MTSQFQRGDAIYEIRKILIPHETFRNFVLVQLLEKFGAHSERSKTSLISWKATLLGEMLRVRFGNILADMMAKGPNLRKLWKNLHIHITRNIMHELKLYSFLCLQRHQFLELLAGIENEIEVSAQTLICRANRHYDRHGCPECCGIVEHGVTYAKLSFVTGEERMIDSMFGKSVLIVRLSHVKQQIEHLTVDINRIYFSLSKSLVLHFQNCWAVRAVTRLVERREKLREASMKRYIERRMVKMKADILQSEISSYLIIDRSKPIVTVFQLADKFCDVPYQLQQAIVDEQQHVAESKQQSCLRIVDCYRRYMSKKYMNKFTAGKACKLVPSLNYDPIQRVIQHRAYMSSLTDKQRLAYQTSLAMDVARFGDQYIAYKRSLLLLCPRCDKTFKFKSLLDRHLADHVKSDEELKAKRDGIQVESKFCNRIKRQVHNQPITDINIWKSLDECLAIPPMFPPLLPVDCHFRLEIWNESPKLKELDIGCIVPSKFDIIHECSKFGYDATCDIRVHLTAIENEIHDNPLTSLLSPCHFFIQVVRCNDSRFKSSDQSRKNVSFRAIIRDNNSLTGTWIIRGTSKIRVPSIGENALFLMPKDIIGVAKTQEDEYLMLYMFQT